MMKFGNLLIAGITTGAIYAMFAVCVSVWYRVSNILNLAVGDFAMVGVGAMVSRDARGRVGQSRGCLMGVSDRATRAAGAEALLVGADRSTEAFTAAAEEAVRDLEPASDLHGSSQYRKHLARVTVRRALEAAAAQAGGA